MKKAVYIIVCLLLTAVAAGCRTPKLSEADAQFQRGEYYDASVTYKKVYNKLRKKEERPQRGEVAFKMGRCYRLLNMSARASAAFQNALRYEYPDSTTHFMLAQALHADGKYAAALRSYDKYLEFCPDDSLAINCAEGCRTCLHRSANCTGQQAHNVPGDIQPGQMGVDNHAGAERVPPDPGHHGQQQQRQQQIHRRLHPRKAGHKRQFEKIQIQHHRHKGLANLGDGELDKMPVHCRTSVR